MKIIVTGGCGFIGSHFVEQAVLRGDEILVIDKLTYAGSLDNLAHLPKNSFIFSEVDISDSQTLSDVIKKFGNADCLINFAAESHVDRSIVNPAPFMESNIIGTVNLLELLRLGHFNRMVQVSTDEVYGSIDEGSWDESSPILPRSSYSASKASAEHFCRAYQNTYGVSVAITRCSNNYGERQSAEKLIPKIICSVLARTELPIYGTGLNKREWLYVGDHCDAIWRVVQDLSGIGVFNVGGVELSNLDLISILLREMSVPDYPLTFITDRAGHDFRYSVDDSLIRNALGWRPDMNIDGGIRRTVSWYLNNPMWLENSQRKALL